MLSKFHFVPAFFVILLAACGPASRDEEASSSLETATVETEPVDETHGITTDPLAATGFMTENTIPPSTAEISGDIEVARDADGRPYVQALLGQPLPAFTGTMVDGSVFNSADINRWTLIDVWGIWCGDCMKDSPYVAALSRAIAQDPELDFISVHTPPNAARADEAFGKFGSVENFFRAKGYAYPTVLDMDASIRDTLQVAWTPSYFLVAPDGIVRGYRTDLSVAGGEPVKDLLRDIASVRSEYRRNADNPVPVDNAYQIGPDGVAGLTGPTVFTLPAIERAFAGLTVTPGTGMAEGDVYPVFTVSEPESLGEEQDILYTVEPSWDRGTVHVVLTRNPLVSGPLGEHVGETRLGDIPESERLYCPYGVDESSRALFCGPNEDAKFWRGFMPVDNRLSARDMTPEEQLSDLILFQMHYIPPSPGGK